MTNENETLHQALASLNIFSVPSPDCQRRTLYRESERLGNFNASEGWQLVKQLRFIAA